VSSENGSDFRNFLNETRSLKIYTEVQFSIGEEELKTLRKKDNKKKSKTSSPKKIHLEEERHERDTLKVGDYYQPDPLIHHRKERKVNEVRVDFPHFHGKDDVDVPLD